MGDEPPFRLRCRLCHYARPQDGAGGAVAVALLCIHNARLVTPAGEGPGGVLVGDGGRIEAVLEGGDSARASEVIDAGGKLFFPGFLDAHVHMRDPGFTHKEDFASGTTAAACGGITTVMCMPNSNPAVDSVAGFEAARAAGEGSAFVDFTLQGAIVPGNLDALPELWATGISSFEALLADVPESVLLDDDQALHALATVAELDAIVGVLPGAHAIYMAEIARARPAVAEAAGMAALLEMVRATGARVALRQTSTARGFELARHAKAGDLAGRISVELVPHYMVLDEGALERLGPFAWMIPPLKTAADGAAAAAALADGTVDFMGTDHAPHAIGEKEGLAPWEAMPGTPGLDTGAASILDAACRGRMPFARVAEVLCANPARLFGLAGRKGELAPGADGDLVLVDAHAERTVGPDMIRSKAGRSPFEGTTLKGWPVLTVLGGRIVAENGKMVSADATGRFAARQDAG